MIQIIMANEAAHFPLLCTYSSRPLNEWKMFKQKSEITIGKRRSLDINQIKRKCNWTCNLQNTMFDSMKKESIIGFYINDFKYALIDTSFIGLKWP